MPSVFWPQQARLWVNSFVNFILPPVCANCKKAGELLCGDCLSAIKWVEAPICQCCGQPRQYDGQPTADQEVVCADCQKRPFLLQQIRAATLFTDPIPTFIHKLKYTGSFALSHPLADLMIVAWEKWRVPVDLVIPIPLHRERKQDRGYNQSELLAEPFSRQYHIDFQPNALHRTRHTAPQVNLNAQQRHSNVMNAFETVTPTSVKGRQILLIDDVCTTGATLNAAAQALLAAGATAVSAYCLARAI